MNSITTLIVHDEERPFEELYRRLKELNVPSLQLRTFVETKYFLKRLRHPVLIFTDVALPDGTWADVLEAAKNATFPSPVIVVSRFVDLNLYLETLQKGAADFIVAPFTTNDLEFIIRSAMTQLGDSPDPACAASDCQLATVARTSAAEVDGTGRGDVGCTEAPGRALAASSR
jgi:FixJ family two-component response regulator